MVGLTGHLRTCEQSKTLHIVQILSTKNLLVKGGNQMVGLTGFEPATPTTPRWCATKLRYSPRLKY